jgi:hypothetical protein
LSSALDESPNGKLEMAVAPSKLSFEPERNPPTTLARSANPGPTGSPTGFDPGTNALCVRSRNSDSYRQFARPAGDRSRHLDRHASRAESRFRRDPPTITGARPIAVRAPRRAKSTRVTYVLSGTDESDGPVAVTCFPPSGSRLKIGRTKVNRESTRLHLPTRQACRTTRRRRAHLDLRVPARNSRQPRAHQDPGAQHPNATGP